MGQLIGFKSEFIAEEQEENEGQKQNDKLLHLKQILPPFNFSAKSPSSIYKLQNLMYERDSIDPAFLEAAIEECSQSGSRAFAAAKRQKSPESTRSAATWRTCSSRKACGRKWRPTRAPKSASRT